MSTKTTAEKDFRDLGFGTRISEQTQRLINTDGTFNVKRKGGGIGAIHPFQFLISAKWWQFWTLVLLAYLIINSLFAFVYVLVGVENLSGAPDSGEVRKFLHAFYFSVQTITTVGYGAISPLNDTVSLISSFEALLGLMGFAIASGVLYGRFSKPSAKIRFSKKALIAPYHDINSFQCRIVNRRKNQLIELEAQVFLVKYEKLGHMTQQRFYKLTLEREKISLFPLNWTIVHPIDTNSPLYDLTEEELMANNAEFLILIKGYDDTFAQMVHARYSYKCKDLYWGAKFEPIYHSDKDGMTIVEINKIDTCTQEELNDY